MNTSIIIQPKSKIIYYNYIWLAYHDPKCFCIVQNKICSKGASSFCLVNVGATMLSVLLELSMVTLDIGVGATYDQENDGILTVGEVNAGLNPLWKILKIGRAHV